MVKANNIYELAGELSNQFGRVERSTTGETIYVIKDDTTELGGLAKDIVYGVHDGSFPSDYLYELVVEILDTINELETDDVIELELQPDIYTSELIGWLKDNKGLVEDAITEYGFNGDLDASIQMAQVMQKEEVARHILNMLEDAIEDSD